MVHHLDHPNIDNLIKEGFTLPRWHLSISFMIALRVLAVLPGSLLCYALSALFVVALVLWNNKHWYNSHCLNEKSFGGECLGNSIIIDDTKKSILYGSLNSDNALSPTLVGLSHHEEVDIDPSFSSTITDEKTLSRLDQKTTNQMPNQFSPA